SAPGSAHVAGVAERVAPGLRPHREAVRLLADGNGHHFAGRRVDHVHDVVVAPGEPQTLAVHADVAHVGAAALGDRPRRDDLPRCEVDDGHAARPFRFAADLRLATVGHVELRAVTAGIEAVGAHAGLDKADLLERVAVDQVDTAALQLGHVEDL